MSRNPKGFDIPWFFVIVAFMSGAWPVGVLLLVLRELPIGKAAAAVSAAAASQSEGQKKGSCQKEKSQEIQIRQDWVVPYDRNHIACSCFLWRV